MTFFDHPPFPLLSLLILAMLVPADGASGEAPAPKGALPFQAPAKVQYRFGQEMGDRVAANIENWLVRAPLANPGMIEMFRVRDREPVPQLVPWAGEFIGKYLISAIQALHMSPDPRLPLTVKTVIDEFVATQAEDGYLGPFRKDNRLLGEWDLWGHYHAFLALLLWHQETGEAQYLQATERAADLICRIYIDSGRRPLDAGSDEMNLSVVHAMGQLYRTTGNPRYLQFMEVIQEDWKKAGDYFEQGLAGVPYYQLPRCRWESLHNVEGLVEFYLITGNEDYKTAFVNLWDSITRFDRHNTGAFSTNEGAIGNPYTPGAIETCCTVAWAALSRDMLMLTGQSRAADELEWSLWNSILGSQHPSGRWWTYNTPMDGKREASAHTIVFQSRAGTPELNCCSVNAPRGIGMISEWGILSDRDGGLVLNYFGPYQAEIRTEDKSLIEVECRTDYPKSGHVEFILKSEGGLRAPLQVRIPSWSEKTTVRLDGKKVEQAIPGSYLALPVTGKSEVRLTLDLDFSIRTWVGNEEAFGKVSLYRGPLLLAFDQHWNDYDGKDFPTLDATRLDCQSLPVPAETFSPMVLLEFKGADGRPVRLVDFATAGAYGTEYLSWLPVEKAAPPVFHLLEPRPDQKIAPGLQVFKWTGPGREAGLQYSFAVAAAADMKDPLFEAADLTDKRLLFPGTLATDRDYYWQVVSKNAYGTTVNEGGPQIFRVDGSLAPIGQEERARVEYREDGLVSASPLAGSGAPDYGHLSAAEKVEPTSGRKGEPDGAVRFGGESKLLYEIPYWPTKDYTFTAWVFPEKGPEGRLAQIFSGWCRGGDDPLRVTLDGDKLFARIEGSGMHSTPGVPVRYGQWQHLAAIKQGGRLTLYLDGIEAGSTGCPADLKGTRANHFALGANPYHTGPEFFTGAIADFAFWSKALSAEEIAAMGGGE